MSNKIKPANKVNPEKMIPRIPNGFLFPLLKKKLIILKTVPKAITINEITIIESRLNSKTKHL